MFLWICTAPIMEVNGGNRIFDILINDRIIATEHLKAEKPREFVEYVYPIPF